MKYLLLLFAISGFFSPNLKGQVGFMDSTNTWTEVHYYLLGHQSFKYTMSSESKVFNGKTYYEILYSLDEEGGTWKNTWGYMRYDDQKLFGGYSDGEALIFDYSIELNDTLTPESGPIYIVTGIDSVLLGNGEKRKRLHTQCLGGHWGDWTIYWIEGLPSSAGLIEHHSFCAADAGSELLCIWKNDELLYSNPDVDSCWYLPVKTVEILPSNIRILGNPIENWLIISDPDEELEQATVFDLFGRRIYSGRELNINMEMAPQGYYLLSITTTNGNIMTTRVLKL